MFLVHCDTIVCIGLSFVIFLYFKSVQLFSCGVTPLHYVRVMKICAHSHVDAHSTHRDRLGFFMEDLEANPSYSNLLIENQTEDPPHFSVSTPIRVFDSQNQMISSFLP